MAQVPCYIKNTSYTGALGMQCRVPSQAPNTTQAVPPVWPCKCRKPGLVSSYLTHPRSAAVTHTTAPLAVPPSHPIPHTMSHRSPVIPPLCEDQSPGTGTLCSWSRVFVPSHVEHHVPRLPACDVRVSHTWPLAPASITASQAVFLEEASGAAATRTQGLQWAGNLVYKTSSHTQASHQANAQPSTTPSRPS